jgi:carbon monoxide dehydrogenase subunit G
MATETLERQLTTTLAAPEVWARLTDMTAVAGWLPILHEVVELAPLAHYRAVLQDKVGPFALKADLDIDVVEAQEPSDVTAGRIAVKAAGEDRQVRSRITIDAAIDVAPSGDGSHVTVRGSYEITGKVATLGAGTIRSKARKLVDEFCTSAAAALTGPGRG